MGLQTRAEVRNGARIVFDVNAPIDTAETRAIFAGRPGRTYSFYSVAHDRA